MELKEMKDNTFKLTLDNEELEILVSYAVNTILKEKIKELEEEKDGK